nr:hypothetical protein [Deltaproteobacteria bacterium]
MRAASSRWFVLPFLVSLVGCAGNTMVPNGEADVPEIPGVDSGLPGDDTGAPPLMCPDGQTRCGDACFDLTSDRAHCGSCERFCGDGESCSSSTCQTSCAAGQTSCGAPASTPPATPPTAAAAAPRAPPSRPSAAGARQTAAMRAAGQTDCGGALRRHQHRPAHCGGCGRSCARASAAPRARAFLRVPCGADLLRLRLRRHRLATSATAACAVARAPRGRAASRAPARARARPRGARAPAGR